MPAATTRAAVLVPIVDRGDDLTVLLTLRATDLKHHAGQISFPGGRMEADDADATAAALREAGEEIGLAREFVEVLGCLPDHAVITGYRVTPVVGIVRPGFSLVLDPTEVAGTFEAPLRHLLDPSTRTRRRRNFAGEEVEFLDLPWGQFNIWGATAGMLFTLRDVLGGPPPHGH
jgi:8-oxo-dGTP pyrophosphatase MutT (NUDIX family)